jgi:hypothetical protein
VIVPIDSIRRGLGALTPLWVSGLALLMVEATVELF